MDPSLFVLEPVISERVGGLEVFDEASRLWVAVDGDRSPAHARIREREGEGGGGMVCFVGKAFADRFNEGRGERGEAEIRATRHRCVAPREEQVGVCRRAVIFEQKYIEYM